MFKASLLFECNTSLESGKYSCSHGEIHTNKQQTIEMFHHLQDFALLILWLLFGNILLSIWRKKCLFAIAIILNAKIINNSQNLIASLNKGIFMLRFFFGRLFSLSIKIFSLLEEYYILYITLIRIVNI